MTERFVEINGAYLFQFGQLVVWSDGERIELGILGKEGGRGKVMCSTIKSEEQRERVRIQFRDRNRKRRARLKELHGG